MERNKEIALHKDMLKAQSKSMESERQAIRYVSIILLTYFYIHVIYISN